jgi:hypothetical protein
MSERPEWVPADVPDECVSWWLDTLGGKMAEIEYRAKLLGAHDVLARLDQVRALTRDKAEHAAMLAVGLAPEDDR